jgi:rod shape-determining protein MreC
MENFFTRYKNETVLVVILFVQLIALATQVRVPTGTAAAASGGSTRLIRVWAAGIVSPVQRMYVHGGLGFRGLWHDYIDLRGVRKENAKLQQELEQARLEQTRVREDAEQGRRLQALLGFKEQFIGKTLAAQVIGTSGTELSRVIYIDRGTHDGIEPGMAVITADGIVGKISRADRSTSQVLLITDPSSGAGVIMERLRLNGVLKGSTSGYAEVQNIMADEEIKPGDRILTTGGDRVFPKGLPVGTVISVAPDHDRDPFLAVKVKPAVNLGHLEEVLVVTQLMERNPGTEEANSQHPVRAADMLAERLPTYKRKAEQDALKAQEAQQKKSGVSAGAAAVPGGATAPTGTAAASAIPGKPASTAANGSAEPATPNSTTSPRRKAASPTNTTAPGAKKTDSTTANPPAATRTENSSKQTKPAESKPPELKPNDTPKDPPR